MRVRAPRRREIRGEGVFYGVLRATAKGEVDVSGRRGSGGQAVRLEGNTPSCRFAREALQVHIGIQSDALLASASAEVVGSGSDRTDPDGDGVRGELRHGPFAALLVHLALLEMPIVEPMIQDRALPAAAVGLRPPTTTSFVDDFARGRRQFHEIGCANCHLPMMVLEKPVLDIEGLPPIDLSREMRRPALRYDPNLGGYPVWLFSDLKRHDMGKANVAGHVQRGVGRREYLTPRLWGVGDSAPTCDGRAPSFSMRSRDTTAKAPRRAGVRGAPFEEKAVYAST